MRDILCYKSLFTHDTRLRLQENSSVAISILNGDVVANQRSRSGGVSAGVTVSGSSGFASSPGYDDETVRKVLKAAQDNAVFLDSRLRRQGENLPSKPGKGKYIYGKKSELTQSATMEFMRALDDYMKKFPSLISRNLFVSQLCTEKSIVTSDGAEYEGFSPRCNLVLSMSALREGKPVAEREVLGGLGVFETMFSSPEEIFPVIDDLYEALRRKTEGIYPEKGQKICILDADLAGILAHEAIGHTVEADFVSAGSVARNYMDKKAASEKITLVDFAHTAFGKTCPIPVPVDDEGTEGRDAVIIDKGILRSYMHDRQSALDYGTAPTGNARAFRFSDEPIIRMRNTAILPGSDKLSDMIASVEDGYYLCNPGNGQADATSEFMFAITRGYEIKNGELGRALLDTTISGVAFDVLSSVTMVSDDFKWVSGGMCGKKQPIPTGMGGPAIKCAVNIG